MANKRVHFAPKCELIVYKPEPEVAADDDIILRSSSQRKKEKIKSKKSQSKKGESELIVYQPEAGVDDAIVPSNNHKKKDDKSDTKKSKSKKGKRGERSVVARSSRSSKVDDLLELYHQILSQTNPLVTHTGDNRNNDEEHSVSTCSTHDSTMTDSSRSTIRHNNQRSNDEKQYINQRNNEKEEENCIWPDIDDSASLSSTISSLTDSTMSTINSIISTESYLTYLNESDVKSSDIQTLTCQLELLLKEVREDSLKRDGR
jgi:hypothetical protein